MGKLTPEQAAKNRERQRRWRERAFRDPDGHLLSRVNVALDSHAAASLKRLSEGYSLTHRELFERLLKAANTAVIESLRGKGAWRFEDGKLEPGALGAFDLEVRRAPAPGAALLSDDRHADADDEIGTGKSHVNLDADGDTEATNADTAAEIEAGTDPEAFALAPSKLSQAERERLVLDTHRQGHGSRAIAKLTGIGESTARLILKRHGLVNEQRAPMPD